MMHNYGLASFNIINYTQLYIIVHVYILTSACIVPAIGPAKLCWHNRLDHDHYAGQFCAKTPLLLSERVFFLKCLLYIYCIVLNP